MDCDKFKINGSVSDEVQESIRKYLVRKGAGANEAEKLARIYKKNFQKAIKNSSISSKFSEVQNNPDFQAIKTQFPKPSLLKAKEKLVKHEKSLSELYQMYKNIDKSNENQVKIIKVPEPATSNSSKIRELALKSGISREQADILAYSGLSLNEAISTIENLTSRMKQMKLSGYQVLGETFYYRKGLNLTCTECMICFENFDIGDQVISLLCFHTFHKVCNEKWMFTSKGTKCPVCGQTSKDLARIVL